MNYASLFQKCMLVMGGVASVPIAHHAARIVHHRPAVAQVAAVPHVTPVSHPIAQAPCAPQVTLSQIGDVAPMAGGSGPIEFIGASSPISLGPIYPSLAETPFPTDDTTTVVPEPASWAMMVTGFGITGLALRGKRVGVVS